MNAELNNIAATILEKMPAPSVAYSQDAGEDGIVHELAALSLIKLIRDGLGTVPLRMGACKP
jgi:hypothetical protein